MSKGEAVVMLVCVGLFAGLIGVCIYASHLRDLIDRLDKKLAEHFKFCHPTDYTHSGWDGAREFRLAKGSEAYRNRERCPLCEGYNYAHFANCPTIQANQ